MKLKIEWVHTISGTFTDIRPTFFEHNYRQVVRLEELVRWLEERHLELESELIAEVIAANAHKGSMVRHALTEVDILLAELKETQP